MSSSGGRSALIFAAAFLPVADLQLLPLLLPELASRTFPGQPVENLISAYALGAASLPFLLSLRFPRLPSAPLAAAALAASGLSGLAFALAEDFPLALAARFLSGGSSGVVSYAILGWAATLGPRAVTAHSAGFLLAFVLGPAGGAWLAGAFLLRSPYLLTASLTLLLALRIALASQNERTPPGAATQPLAPHRLLRDRRLLKLLLASVFVAAAVAGPVSLFPTVLGDPDRAALDLTGRALVYLCAGAGPVLALLTSRAIHARIEISRLAAGGAVLLAVALGLLPLATHSGIIAAIALALALWCETLRRSALQNLAATLPAPADRPRFLALRSLSVQLGIALGVNLSFSLHAHLTLWAATSTGSALALLAAALVPRVR